MSQTRDQQRLTISEVAADWHEPMVPQRIMWPSIARANGQLDPRYDTIRYDTIRYDSVYLTCSNKLTGSQLSPPHGTNKKLKCETTNKMMSVVGPVQSR